MDAAEGPTEYWSHPPSGTIRCTDAEQKPRSWIGRWVGSTNGTNGLRRRSSGPAEANSTRESLVMTPALLLALVAFRGCPLCRLTKGSVMIDAVATPDAAIRSVYKTLAVALSM